MTLAAGYDRGLGWEGHPGNYNYTRVRSSTITHPTAAKEAHFCLGIHGGAGC